MSSSVPSVFEYLDYRAFMRDLYAAKKSESAKFSFRFFARKAGFSSSNFLKLVMDGDRNLGPTAIERVASALKLDKDESAFFADLVAMNQAQTVSERNRAFERVAANRRFRAARKLDGPLFEYLTRWYYPVIGARGTAFRNSGGSEHSVPSWKRNSHPRSRAQRLLRPIR